VSKVNLLHYLNTINLRFVYGGVEAVLLTLLISAIEGDELAASRFGSFFSRRRARYLLEKKTVRGGPRSI
jgi:hypothetical protein